jgi:hypothetical protein
MERWREKYSAVDFSTASPEIIKAMQEEKPSVDFHEHEYKDTINYALSKRSLNLLDELAELGIYGETRLKLALASWIRRSRICRAQYGTADV